jgi:SNF2 family DNA or RNA helicase
LATALHLPRLNYIDGRIALRCPFQDKDLAKSIAGARWNPDAKCWTYPVRPEVLADLRRLFPHMIVEADAEQALQHVIEREREARRIKDIEDDSELENLQLPVKVKPFLHQKKAFKIGITLPNFAALMEMGTGKTLTSIAIAGHRFLYDGVRRLLVVAPLSVVPVWPKEFTEFAAYPTRVVALSGTSSQKAEQLRRFPKIGDELQVAVVNYESAWRIEENLKIWLRAAGAGGSMIIADESQRIKTPSATQSKAMHRLGAIASYKIILTGTPVTQSPLDFFSQYKFLDPSIFGTNYTAFKARYAIMGGFENRQIIGYQMMHELVAKAHSIAYRVTKAEAIDLPEETTRVIPITLGSRSLAVYNEIKRDKIAELSGGTVTAANVLTALLRLSQVAGGYVTDENGRVHQVGSEKLDVFDDLMTDLIDAGKKVVVFARFIPEIRAICDLLEKRGIQHRYITGEVSQADRGAAVQTFQMDPDVKVFVAQIQTAGLGITLTAADTAIFYSMDFSLANHEQAKARVHRIGQKFPVTYIYLLAAGTVDEQIYQALQDKKNIADTVVDRWREFIK